MAPAKAQKVKGKTKFLYREVADRFSASQAQKTFDRLTAASRQRNFFMAKTKLYIAVKCGLVEDSKHREAIGNRIWLYLHILNRCNWDTGKVTEWRDKEESADMDMNHRTLTAQRQELSELGYISCKQKGNHQEITVHNWTNPRSYGAETMNEKGTQKSAPFKSEGTAEGTAEGSNDLSTPTLNQITLYSIAQAIADVCNIQLEANKGRMMREAKLLSKASPPPTVELIKQHYNGNKSAFWKSTDWRGRKGQRPTPSSIRETWGQWNIELDNSNTVTLTPEQAQAQSPHVRV